MGVEKHEFIQIGSSKAYVIEYEKEAFGQGAQGHLHQIIKVNNTPYGTWAIKLLHQSSVALSQRLLALTEFITANGLNTEGLSCTPALLLQSTLDHTLAIPMRRALGPDLESGGGLPANSSLAKRLAAARELARCVRRLHEQGMVIGDLSHDNLIIDPKNWALYLIDIDGAGFVWNGRTYSVIADNSPKGELCPPEFSGQSYTQEMDLWGLSVLLHFILTDEDPMSLFGLARTYASSAKISWPPPEHPKYESHLSALESLGQPLKAAFIHSFNQGRLLPNHRLRAHEWENLLDEAQNYLYQCNCSPDKPFVALSAPGQILYECPKCGNPIMARP